MGYILITAFAPTIIRQVSKELKTFEVTEAPAPAEVPPAPETPTEPAPVVAAKPLIQTPIKAAPVRAMSAPASSAAGLAQRARWRSGAFYNDTDYPSDALRHEQQGTVQVTYVIGADGRVASCSVTASSGSSSLDATTCRIMQKRFRFEPAQDSNGTPIAETRSQAVTWRLG
jgi:protein TonB